MLAGAPRNVEVTLREKDGARFLFLLNHGAKAAAVKLGTMGGVDLITGMAVKRVITLAARGVAVVRLA